MAPPLTVWPSPTPADCMFSSYSSTTAGKEPHVTARMESTWGAVAIAISFATIAGSSAAASTAFASTFTVSLSVTLSASTLYSPLASAVSSVSTPSMTVLTLSTCQPSAAWAVNFSSSFAGTSTGLVSSSILFPSLERVMEAPSARFSLMEASWSCSTAGAGAGSDSVLKTVLAAGSAAGVSIAGSVADSTVSTTGSSVACVLSAGAGSFAAPAASSGTVVSVASVPESSTPVSSTVVAISSLACLLDIVAVANAGVPTICVASRIVRMIAVALTPKSRHPLRTLLLDFIRHHPPFQLRSLAVPPRRTAPPRAFQRGSRTSIPASPPGTFTRLRSDVELLPVG